MNCCVASDHVNNIGNINEIPASKFAGIFSFPGNPARNVTIKPATLKGGNEWSPDDYL